MIARRTLLALAAAFAWPALAQPAPVKVALTTSEGRIVLELYPDKAPVTVANFLRYVDAKKYDGAEFYRASRPAGATTNDYGILQGGIRDAAVTQFAAIAHESTSKTGLTHTNGTISLGRFAPGTAKSDFFICVGDHPYLDADPKAAGDNLGFAAFGKVVEGMAVVKRILALPTNGKTSEPAMKGQMINPPVPIVSMKRL
ncbi:MAG: peptidylprolyl isomerase [Phenylobacterium sp.]